jgi:DNA-binding LacI/PurR family transcriptional regulator
MTVLIESALKQGDPARMSDSDGHARGPATLEAVAAAAGVSRATVSRVVNGGAGVSAETRRVVEQAVARMAYVPNRAARSLVTRRTDSIGLVIPEPTTKLFADPFFPRVLKGITEVLVAAEQQLVLLTPESRQDEARLVRYLAAGHVDGVMLVSLHGMDPLPGELARRGVPVVVGGRPTRGTEVDYVDVDNVHGARTAVRHLVGIGRRRIVTVTGPLDMAPAADRLEGYRRGLAEAGLQADPALELPGDFEQGVARDSIERFLAQGGELDAVFAASDLMALGVMSALGRAGRRVPDDVAVVGYDDSPLALTTEPPLSSVRQPIEEMGREMARAVLAGVDGPKRIPRSVVLSTELVVRASSGG